jgi:EmrB/QacA subfamily drug resistance transporter
LSDTHPHPEPSRALIIAVMLAVWLAALDQTIVATALPRITQALGGEAWYAWVFSSYMVATIVFVPLSGALGDIKGRRPVLLWGLAAFTAGSWLAGSAQDMPALVAFRALQGMGAGILTANSFALLGDLYPPGRAARATGLMTAVYGLAGVLGPPLGGVLTDTLGWRWIFWCNVPLALIMGGILWQHLPRRTRVIDDPIDTAGAVWLTGFLLPSLALLGGAGEGLRFDDPRMQIAAGMALPCAVLFFRAEKRAVRPIIELRLFRHRDFSLAMTGMFSVALAMYAALTYAPLLFQEYMRMTPTGSGLVTAPLVLTLAVAAGIAGRLTEKGIPTRSLAVTGMVTAALAMGWLGMMPSTTSAPVAGFCMALMGAGLGLTMPPMLLSAQAAAGHDYLGVTTALAKFFRSVGGLMGVVLAGALIRHFQGGGEDSRPLSQAILFAAGVMLVSIMPMLLVATQAPTQPQTPPGHAREKTRP